MSNIDLSVVLTTHLRPKLLKRAIESLLGQTNTDFRIILCSDEGSQDTKDIAKNFLREKDCFLVLPHLIGPSSTRNEGVRNVASKNLIFLDDDDTFELNFFEKITNTVKETSQSLYYFNFTKYVEQRDDDEIALNEVVKINQANNYTNIIVGNFIPNNSFIVNSLVAKSIQFDTSLNSHEDWDYLIELSKKVSFKHVDIYGPNVHAVSDSGRNSDSYKNGSVALDFLSIYRKHPAKDLQAREARRSQLSAFGIAISPELL